MSGVVLLDGRPLTTGAVTTTLENGRGTEGTIGSDGTFVLETRGVGIGAEVGTHKVAVMSYESSDPGNYEAPFKLLVPGLYTDAYTSGLVLEVKPEGATDVKIELYSKRRR